MNLPFKDFPATDSLREAVEKRADKVKTRYPEISTFEVVLAAPHQHKHQGNLFTCHIEVHLPRVEPIVIDHDPDDNHAHEDAYVAIRDAFKALEKRLEHATAHPRHR